MSVNLPKVSIILPVYNGADRVGKSIESCLKQTYKNIELIIVDDGSSDGTDRIIQSYTDRRIKYIRHRKNTGLPISLNTGFAHSEGEFLTWTSDDNQYLPTAIEEMLLFLIKNNQADLVYADYWAHYIETDRKVLRKMPDKLNLAKINGVGACFLYTRRVYEEIGNYNPKYRLVEDYDYWMRINKRFKVVHYPKPIYIYGEHSKSLTSTKRSTIFLITRILRYQHKYISLRQFQSAFLQIFKNSDQTGPPASVFLKIFFLTLRNIVRVSRLSLRVSLICLFFLATLFPYWFYDSIWERL